MLPRFRGGVKLSFLPFSVFFLTFVLHPGSVMFQPGFLSFCEDIFVHEWLFKWMFLEGNVC